jgi:hypothetical protein
MPLRANFALPVVKEELERIGIFLIEEFPGQTRWGTEPLRDGPYGGDFTMASEYMPGRYDIFAVRAILNCLEMAGHIPAVEERLFNRINEGVEEA